MLDASRKEAGSEVGEVTGGERPRSSTDRPVVLVLTGYYLPGYRAGGPVRSLSNMIERLGDEFEFWVVTPDHDHGTTERYPDVVPGVWQSVDKAKVLYLADEDLRSGALTRVLATHDHDVLYLNSFFHPWYTVRPLWQRLRQRSALPAKALVAPRGELGPGALRLKAFKKRAFMALSRVAGLYADVSWHATGADEARAVRAFVRQSASVFVAPNIATTRFATEPNTATTRKEPGELRLVFASRIMRKKNVLYAIRALSQLRGSVSFDILGPIEDEAYWRQCLAATRSLPNGVVVRHRGAIPPDEMPRMLDGYDVFFMPTLNENYGHAIVEALARGLPAVISDQTPWRNLAAAGAGADLDLASPDAFTAVLQAYVDMDDAEFQAARAAARAFGCDHVLNGDAVVSTRRMLHACVENARETSGA